MAAPRIAFALGSALLLLGLTSGIGFAQIRMTDPQDGSPGEQVETTEITDAAGNSYQVETHTDAYGRRRQIVRPILATALSRRGESPTPAGLAEPVTPAGVAEAARWRSIAPDGGDVHTIATSPLDPRLVLAGLSSEGLFITPRRGVYRSLDGGRTWQAAELEGSPPFGVSVNLIRFAPDGTAYAASTAGLWKSVDGGATWRRLGGDSFRPYAWVVAIEPGAPQHLWLGLAHGQGIVRSLDGGATWQYVAVPGVVANTSCRGIAFDGARPGHVYVCFGDYEQGQVWVSTNGGGSWTNRSAGLPVAPYLDILFDGTRLLVGGGSYWNPGGLFASTNEGVSWTNLTTSWVFPRVSYSIVRDIALDPASPCVIWVATPEGGFRSSDCGANWAFNVARSAPEPACVEVAPGGIVFEGAAENYGVYRREGSGNFVPSYKGMKELHVYSVASNPLDPRELAAAFQGLNSGGVCTSRDGGEKWLLDPTLHSRINHVMFDRLGRLYAVSDGPSTIEAEGLYRRNADGTWTGLGPDQGPYFETGFDWLQISPHDPNLIVGGGPDYVNRGFGQSLWQSTNGGATWTKAFHRDEPYAMSRGGGTLVDDGTDRAAVASLPLYTEPLVLRSEDRGATWLPAAAGLPSRYAGSLVAASPRTGQAYLGGGGLYRSTDQGRTWQLVAGSTAYGFKSLVVDLADDRILYGIIYSSGGYHLARSHDYGDTFQDFGAGLTPPVGGTQMSVATGTCPDVLLAATSGVYARGVDTTPPALDVQSSPLVLWPPNDQMVDIHAAVSVSDACDPAPTFVLTSITCDEPGAEGDIEGADMGQPDTDFKLRATRQGTGPGRTYSILYTGTDADGNATEMVRTVRVPHDQRVATRGAGIPTPAGDLAPSETRLPSVSPSPFRSTTSIAFDLAAAAPVSVRIFDLRGASVRTLLDGFRPSGRHRLDWDGRDDSGGSLPDGMYWIRFATAGQQQTQRVVRLR